MIELGSFYEESESEAIEDVVGLELIWSPVLRPTEEAK